MSDTIKAAAVYIREELSCQGFKIGSSHAHAAVAAYCGHNSKKALIDDESLDIEDEELVLHISPDIEKLSQQILKMKETPLQTIPVEKLAKLIQIGLTPSCECCDEKKSTVQSIGDNHYDSSPDGWVCQSCASTGDDYSTCIYCGDEVIHRSENINAQGECPEHAGESAMDDEEEKDWDDYIEYNTKDA